MSLKIIPENSQKSSISSTSYGEAAAHAPGLQDILRNQEGPLNLASKLNNRHPLEARIGNWEETQYDTRMETYRRVFGAGEPIRRAMELEIVSSDFRPSILGGPDSMHRDILLNKDASVDWEDVYTGGLESGANVKDFHTDMEKSVGI
ncbi:proteasome maturation factor UMP1 [Suhomyces tanzawaensis NRRL Y-17324]|uniref:Proteasome maturation factor UMP1 n=1 Tax=Suhomyces tanzawaensis NRRL Y-17324 TaxID=984487 RepID=A0A1E4SEU1_9ASCO|nr:proteasome maturation factor UMP1 [Suhomyces tanzawaensis NRRL Y-17324]ODV78025.1 proteasome maturation factor UMP1 [Suhomyces tanzawaensis NRRL Y-17324]